MRGKLRRYRLENPRRPNGRERVTKPNGQIKSLPLDEVEGQVKEAEQVEQ